jgi:hypothetical protein
MRASAYVELVARRNRLLARVGQWLVDTEQRMAALQREDEHLRSDLAALEGGALKRTRAEIHEAIEDCRQFIAAPGIALRRQYAAARVAEALTWVLERPESRTGTQFDRDRLA